MEIKILGSGCSKCNYLLTVTQTAVIELGIEAQVTKVDDLQQIAGYGIMRTPALVINEKVAVSGRVPSISEIKEILKRNI